MTGSILESCENPQLENFHNVSLLESCENPQLENFHSVSLLESCENPQLENFHSVSILESCENPQLGRADGILLATQTDSRDEASTFNNSKKHRPEYNSFPNKNCSEQCWL